MDQAELRQAVKDAINQRLSLPTVEEKAFTSVDISHPIIEADVQEHGKRTVFHRQVNTLIHEMFAAGELVYDEDIVDGGIPLLRTAITVYPKPGKSATAFLYYPDDPNYDPNSYNERNQELVVDAPQTTPDSGDPQASKTRGFDMDDDDADDCKTDDGATVVTTTATGAPVSKQCQIQRRHDTINIPSVLVRSAGWGTGDPVSVNAVGPTIYVRRKVPGQQRVDGEGRIRIHGKNVDALGKGLGDTCTALLVTPKDGEKYIQIQ
jgi:hypothetical protein